MWVVAVETELQLSHRQEEVSTPERHLWTFHLVEQALPVPFFRKKRSLFCRQTWSWLVYRIFAKRPVAQQQAVLAVPAVLLQPIFLPLAILAVSAVPGFWLLQLLLSLVFRLRQILSLQPV